MIKLICQQMLDMRSARTNQLVCLLQQIHEPEYDNYLQNPTTCVKNIKKSQEGGKNSEI